MLPLVYLDWIEAAEVLKRYWQKNAQVDEDQSADEGNICFA